MFESFSDCIERFGLAWDKLVSVTTDGTPSLIGKNVELIKRMNDKV